MNLLLILCLAVLCLLKAKWESFKVILHTLVSLYPTKHYRLIQRKFCNCCSNTVDASVILIEVSSLSFLIEVSIFENVFLYNLSRMDYVLLLLCVSHSVFLPLQMLPQKQLALC